MQITWLYLCDFFLSCEPFRLFLGATKIYLFIMEHLVHPEELRALRSCLYELYIMSQAMMTITASNVLQYFENSCPCILAIVQRGFQGPFFL